MASKWYPLGVEIMLEEGYQFDSTNIKAMLTASSVSYNTAHNYLDDVSAGRIDTDKALVSPALTTSSTTVTFDSDDSGTNLTWSSIAAGSTVGSVILYYNTGTEGTSPLIAFCDVTDTPTNGGNIVIAWDASGIATLAFA